MTYLAYRVRRPIIEGRGVSTVVARSRDGLVFEPVCEVDRDAFGAESFERPVVLRTPDRRLAALPVLCHARLQALVDRGPRRRPSRGPAPRPPDRGAGGRRPGRRQGPGDPGRRRRRLARLDLRAPPDRRGARGPDVDRLRHQHRWPAVGAGRHRAVAPRPASGTRVAPGSPPSSPSTHWSSCTTADRPQPTTGTSAPVSREARSATPARAARPRPPGGRDRLPPLRRGAALRHPGDAARTARFAGTPRWPAPTGPTTSCCSDPRRVAPRVRLSRAPGPRLDGPEARLN